MDNQILLIDGCMGIYVPQRYAVKYPHLIESIFTDNTLEILLAGPEHEHYWEAWDDVLRAPITFDGKKWRLEQDEDLFAIRD